MSWTTPRSWVPGELVSASMLNTHIRDNENSLRSEHFPVQRFRGLHLRTHPDEHPVSGAGQVYLAHADEIVMDDGTRLGPWDRMSANVAASGAGGLDAGSEAASTWYEIYAIAKDDGTKNLLLHKSKKDALTESQTTDDAVENLRQGATDRVLLAQGFQKTTGSGGPCHFVDLKILRVGTIALGAKIWLEIRSDASGSPSGTVLATSDKFEGAAINSAAQVVRFIFKNPATIALSTQYHLVLNADYAVSTVNYMAWRGQSTDVYANGSAKKYDGTSWAAATPLDFWFKVFLRLSDTAVVLPSGYTKKAKIGHVFNDSGSNFIRFIARDHVVSTLDNQPLGSFTLTAPTLQDLSTLVPVGLLTVRFGGGHNTDNGVIYAAGMPYGFSVTTTTRYVDGRRFVRCPGAGENPAAFLPPVCTEFQGLYTWVDVGQSSLYFDGYEW